MTKLVPPHGSDTLKSLALEGNALTVELERAKLLPKINCSSREEGDIIMMGVGGFTPLEGFMGKADWQSVCDNMTIESGLFWPIPITLSTDNEGVNQGDEVALVNGETDEIIATMVISEKYSIDKTHECNTVYKTTEIEHPGVVMVMAQGKYNLAGSIKVLSDGGFPEKYSSLYMTPMETRAYFDDKGWKTVAAFQTRNPMHRSHEYLVKIAVEVCDGVMIHSVLGNLKAGDIPANVRSEAISVLIENYFVDNTILQSGYPLDMRYAGPREALLHALFRQNYGCSHLIVGRDHAGIDDYYGPFDAHNIFDEIADDALMTKALKIDWTFWCHKCGGMSSMKTCPHSAEDRALLSGTKVRKMLSDSEDLPETFSRPEVAKVLQAYYAGIKDEDKVEIKLNGHSAK
ncbi:sulfate adenylyltransferase [Candidatus Ruthia magnifica str. Cm (Calyptogena magnifica)]|uniref:Sulfate adenylyltransferase n=1 Tax=Ruthia magnifica subsp. Calyptogena magnifica TaxID=413404 RepID=SAT_RUTMC|nr:sulfate adenylyltransferase [Candidatus Ruthturnera calyptogenae]A1AVC7.1 RecName: Full=Sulfate adenylyltransferase; AltName: Full=ATP-sulfurylase; AltName: Full=Sulfate adenylate transferase; Short=SAT [Candidatus Ruthia magnifica str. Cm (Calyptogena magnifica)]ABL01884.1 sulfate adenylyltransferase [Candidatus Ruthia magnifica str. Cm (Calyptogena magnifica)]